MSTYQTFLTEIETSENIHRTAGRVMGALKTGHLNSDEYLKLVSFISFREDAQKLLS